MTSNEIPDNLPIRLGETLKRLEVNRIPITKEKNAPVPIIREKTRRMFGVDIPISKITWTYSVYLLLAQNGLVKIGYTQNLRKRISGLKNMSPIELKYIGYLYCDSRDTAKHIERRIHLIYDECRHHGEWFSISQKDIDGILSEYNFILVEHK